MNAVAGLWRADPAVALIVAGLAANSGRDAWRRVSTQQDFVWSRPGRPALLR